MRFSVRDGVIKLFSKITVVFRCQKECDRPRFRLNVKLIYAWLSNGFPRYIEIIFWYVLIYLYSHSCLWTLWRLKLIFIVLIDWVLTAQKTPFLLDNYVWVIAAQGNSASLHNRTEYARYIHRVGQRLIVWS